MTIYDIREKYHQKICKQLLRIRINKQKGNYPNNADGDSNISVKIAWGIINLLTNNPVLGNISGQEAGHIFENLTKEYIEETFKLLNHLRPGKWNYSTHTGISQFDQYRDLANIEKFIKNNKDLASTFGMDYLISPDIVVSREPVSIKDINRKKILINPNDTSAKLTPLRKDNYAFHNPILHASISCKWTLRSDRGQNARTEALNLIRNRKGKLPHIIAVTGEPTANRIASLALGTGDIDCVYHFALNELRKTINEINDESQLDMLNTLIDGRRLRDISDLPFDLAT